MRATRLPLVPLALLARLLSADAVAAPTEGLRSLAMGGTLRGAASGAEGTLLNPSGIALFRQYAVTALYSFGLQQLGHGVHVSVADSMTHRRVAMGLYYNFIHESPPVSLIVAEAETAEGRLIRIRDIRLTRKGHEVGLLSAFPLGDRLILGVTTKYGYFSTTAQLPADQLPKNPPFAAKNPRIDKDQVYDLGSMSNVVSFDVGLTVRALDRLSIGLAAQNLWGHGSEMPTMLGAGLALKLSQLVAAADAVVNFTGYQSCEGGSGDPCNLRQAPDQPEATTAIVVRIGAGLEYAIVDKVPLRAGYLFDSSLGGHHISAGFGYLSSRFGLDLAFRQRLSAGPETILVGGVRVFRE